MVRNRSNGPLKDHRPLFGLAILGLVLLAGCGGGDEPGGGGAVELTKWLPREARSYYVVDVSAVKEDLGLAEDAHPFDPLTDQTQDSVFQLFALFMPPPEKTYSYVTANDPSDSKPQPLSEIPLMKAVDPSAVTAAAQGVYGRGSDAFTLVALRTTADTGEIGSALGDLGYTDSDGLLVPPDELGGAPSVKLEEGLIFASDDPGAFRSLTDEPADELPLRILGEVAGNEILAVSLPGIPTGNRQDCVDAYALAGDRNGGEVAYLVDGEAEADRFSPQPDDEPQVEEVDADGDLLVAHIRFDGGTESIRVFGADELPRYECE